MADVCLPGDGGYIYSPTEPYFIFPLLKNHCISPYMDDVDIEAQRPHVDSKPSCSDETSPLLENPASHQQTVSKRFDFGLSKFLALLQFFGGSCFGHEIAEIQDIEELERKYEAQRRELDGLRRERDNLKQSLKQEKQIIYQKEAQWKKSMETASSQLQDEQSKVEAISSQLQDVKSKVKAILSRFQDEKSKVEAVSSQLKDEKSKVEAVPSQIQIIKSKMKAISSQLQDERSKVEKISSQLQDEKAKVAELQKYIEKNEKVVTKAHETHVSSLSKSVSRPFTDDIIKDELKRFYENYLLPWCGDLGSMEVDEPEKAKEKLQSMGIINNSKSYLNEPTSLQFSMDLPDGKSPMVLLQAVLSQTLCDTFLRDAYFLADGMETSKVPGQDPSDSRRWLKEVEDVLFKVDKSFGVDWRIQTVQSLERATPFNLHLVQNKAKNFVQEFHFLLKQLDDQALKDLSQLFLDFGNLALKFWKTRTIIKTHGMSRFSEQKFEVESPFIEADIVGSPAARQRRQGRYVGVLVRPLIVSEPLGQDDEASEEVVWLKAAGWVSDFEDSVETPAQNVIDDGDGNADESDGGGESDGSENDDDASGDDESHDDESHDDESDEDEGDDDSDSGDDDDVMMMMTMMMTMTL
ncbi:hypothetical protein THAR02_06164 [Trichoderma harzianum]|uniref:Uncharacterized protein n=1 Tax=Trichoderma harzianum TaxID=5544 RepID=A0A0F9XNA7_TRIHA|nr:hypothetical protein THAR02_06164 [Trichoderma harzianum]